jgi:hypothetical protein
MDKTNTKMMNNNNRIPATFDSIFRNFLMPLKL